MRPLSGLLALLVLLLGTAALLPGQPAVAEDERRQGPEPAPAPDPVFVFDVRIVRVETPQPEGVEQPCPILNGAGSTTQATWPEILSALKKRGTTTILMDGRSTALEDTQTELSEERSVPTVGLTTRNVKSPGGTSEVSQAMQLKTACRAKLLVSGPKRRGGQLRYQIETRGALPATSPVAMGFTQTRHEWLGTSAALGDETLVLSHRQQVHTSGERASQEPASRGIETWCFISTGR